MPTRSATTSGRRGWARRHSSRSGSSPRAARGEHAGGVRVPAATGVAFGSDQHVLAERGQLMAAEWAAIRRGLAIGRAAHRPPRRGRKARRHRSILAPAGERLVAGGVARASAASLVGVGVALAKAERERRARRRAARRARGSSLLRSDEPRGGGPAARDPRPAGPARSSCSRAARRGGSPTSGRCTSCARRSSACERSCGCCATQLGGKRSAARERGAARLRAGAWRERATRRSWWARSTRSCERDPEAGATRGLPRRAPAASVDAALRAAAASPSASRPRPAPGAPVAIGAGRRATCARSARGSSSWELRERPDDPAELWRRGPRAPLPQGTRRMRPGAPARRTSTRCTRGARASRTLRYVAETLDARTASRGQAKSGAGACTAVARRGGSPRGAAGRGARPRAAGAQRCASARSSSRAIGARARRLLQADRAAPQAVCAGARCARASASTSASRRRSCAACARRCRAPDTRPARRRATLQ